MAEGGELAGATGQLVARMPAGTWPMLNHGALMMSCRLNNHLIGGGSMGDWGAAAEHSLGLRFSADFKVFLAR